MATTTFKSRIPQIVAEATAKAELAVRKTAHDIEGGSKKRSRVDTGQMRNGWAIEPLGPAEVLVYNPVEHVIFNEFGTESMPAQPMLTPSVEEAKGPFYAAVAEVYG